MYHPDKRVRRTKDTFKKVLLYLMQTKNFQEISITEIVRTADFNRGTFYAHYEKKEELLDEIIDEMFKNLTIAFRIPFRGKSTFDIRETPNETGVIFEHFYENRNIYRILLRQKNINFYERLRNHFEMLYKSDFNYEVSIKDDKIDLELYIDSRIYSLLGIITTWLEKDIIQPPSYIADQILRIQKSRTPKLYLHY